MKLCFSTLGCPEWRWSEILSFAKDMGYHGIEIRGVRKELYVPRIKQLRVENILASKAELASLGLQIPVLTSACELHKEECRDDTIFECKEYIDVAADIGAKYVRVLGDSSPAPGGSIDVELVKDSAQILGAYAASKGVSLLIESNGYFSDTEKLAKLLDRINSKGVAALWDINHPLRYNKEPVSATMANLGEYIKHLHIKDSAVEENGDVVYRVTGQGTLPIEECVETLLQKGYDGYFSLEWVRRWIVSLEEPGIAFALYAQYMQSL